MSEWRKSPQRERRKPSDTMPAENAKHTQEELVKALIAREAMALQEADVA